MTAGAGNRGQGEGNVGTRRLVLTFAIAVGAVASAAPAAPAPANTVGVEQTFVVATRPGVYGISATTQQLGVRAKDGTKIFVEAWLPAAKDGHVPPTRVPVIVDATPYAMKGVPRPDRLTNEKRWLRILVSRGYALADIHMRGTGESGGCWAGHDRIAADDISRAVEAIATAPWSNGRLAMWGKSHDGGAALNAMEHGDRVRMRYVAAAVVLSPVSSYSDFFNWDGVISPDGTANIAAIDNDTTLTHRSSGATEPPYPVEYLGNSNKDPAAIARRAGCAALEDVELARQDGSMSAWLLERELALDVDLISVPTLYTYGSFEPQSRMMVATFDRIRAPKVGIFSASGHDYPDENSVDPKLSRKDWEAMSVAWLDHWLLGTRPEVGSWPSPQVQDSDGRWRIARGFPATGGVPGRLALSAGNKLGARRPHGATRYREVEGIASGIGFSTGPLPADLVVTGQPVLDAWLVLPRQVNVVAELDLYDTDGNLVWWRYGARSSRFLEPFLKDRFVQSRPADAPLGVPVHVVVRLEPGEFVARKGETLEVFLEGTSGAVHEPTIGAGVITVLHDCTHPSLLRFELPGPDSTYLDVQDNYPRRSAARPYPDGAGLATAPIC